MVAQRTPKADRQVQVKLLNTMKHLLTVLLGAISIATAEPPNIIVIFADDLGYGDLGCYGSKKNPTPRLDQMAKEGLRATDMNVPANVCSPSRSALLTGRYPMRNGHPIYRAHYHKKITPVYGLHPDEITIPELLKPAGYHSFMIGKWHLGFDIKDSHPMDQGFDQYWGHPHNYGFKGFKTSQALIRDRTIEKTNVPFPKMTPTYNREVVKFIDEHPKDKPFFIYMAHQIAHSPIIPSVKFKGKTKKGKYADFIHELDHSVGTVIDALKKNNIEENTLVVFLADNGHTGPGTSKPLSGGKYNTMEGGHRVPGIFRWKGTIPAGQVCQTSLSSMDLFPLFANLAGVELPTDRKIDGKNIKDILLGESTESKHEFLYYYNAHSLQAIRKGKWKLHLPRTAKEQPYWGKAGRTRFFHTLDKPFLVNLDKDIAEMKNVADAHPEVVKMLQAQAVEIQKELGGYKKPGSDQRPGWPAAEMQYSK